jgi:hypothetical protein
MGNWVDSSSMMVKSQPTKMDDLDKENLSINSLHEAVHTAEEEMKEKNSSDTHEKKLQDKTFIESAIESTTVKPEALNNDVPENLVRHSDDLYKEDLNRDGRETDKMG